MANSENPQSCHRSLQYKWLNKVIPKIENVKMSKVCQASYITYVVKEPKIPARNYLLREVFLENMELKIRKRKTLIQ